MRDVARLVVVASFVVISCGPRGAESTIRQQAPPPSSTNPAATTNDYSRTRTSSDLWRLVSE